MPRYYCDYCDTYLTHDSPSVRKQHNAGYKHKANVRIYYQQYEAQLNQSLIDQKVKEHLRALLNETWPSGFPMPRPMPMPMPMPYPGQLSSNTPLMPGIRPPVLARPPGAPGYNMPQMMAPPPPAVPGQLNSLPSPVNAPSPPPAVPGSAGMPTSSGAPPMFAPPMYPGNMAAPPPASDESSDPNALATEAN